MDSVREQRRATQRGQVVTGPWGHRWAKCRAPQRNCISAELWSVSRSWAGGSVSGQREQPVRWLGGREGWAHSEQRMGPVMATQSGGQRWDHVPAPVGVLAGPSEVSMKAAPCPADTARQYYVFSFSEPVSWTLELWVPAMLFFHPAALTNLPPVHPHCSPYYPQPKRRVGKIKRNS